MLLLYFQIRLFGLGLWCLRPLSTMFHLYRGGFIGGGKPNCKHKTFKYFVLVLEECSVQTVTVDGEDTTRKDRTRGSVIFNTLQEV